MQHPLLAVNNLAVDFKQTQRALKEVSFTLAKGELLAIVGESGSGKSVTSLSILQLLPTASATYSNGSIRFWNGDEIIELLAIQDKAIQSLRGSKIAMIFQEPMSSLNPVYTCGNQIIEAILIHQSISRKAARKKTIDLLNKVKLPTPERIFNSYPHQLSGGQKQRVMIAMAMSCKPDLLICDEPTTALDVTVQKSILSLIKELQAENNMGVIFITHDLGIVKEIADRVLVLYKGSIVEEGNTATIFAQPKHPYTKALLSCRPALHPKGKRLPIVSDFMELNEDGEMIAKEFAPAETITVEKNSFNKPLIEVENLRVWYPVQKTFLGKPKKFTRAVDDVSFTIYEGETLGLVGESGCGKSTLGRAIIQLTPAISGKVIYRNENLLSLSNTAFLQYRKELQIIFQDPFASLNPRITIGEAIAEPLWVHKIELDAAKRKEKVINLLQKINLLPEHYNRYPHEFSGGQRQRIVIARALILKPRFVICDESVSALDVSVQAQILNLLNDLKKELGFTALFISHDLSVVRYIADRIMVMQTGRIVEIDEAEKICKHPKEAYTKKLIDSIPGGLMQF